MKTLQAFWHWVDNEKPAAELYAEKALDNLSDVGRAALLEAERLVGVRAGAATVQMLDRVTDEEHMALRPAFRDLSLALCAALEHMHDQVEDDYLGKRYPARPDFQTHAVAPVVPQCPACCSKPCNGTHAGCSLKAYLAAHPEAQPLFKREYVGEWHRSIDLSSDASEETKKAIADWLPKMPPQPIPADGPLSGRRLTAQEQLANAQTFDEATYIRAAMAFGDIAPNAPTLQLQLQANTAYEVTGFSPPSVQLRGRTGSSWDPVRRQLEVFTAIDRDGIDRLRGLQPRTIVVRGKVNDYPNDVLAYLREIIWPMAQCGGAVVNVHEDPALLRYLGFV